MKKKENSDSFIDELLSNLEELSIEFQNGKEVSSDKHEPNAMKKEDSKSINQQK